jgi:ParB/RepB/Spo0J family partition protein
MKQTVRDIHLDIIDPSPFQVRAIDAGSEGICQLADSITRSGLLAPVTVRPAPGGRYELVAGHRRACAARLAGLASIPAIVAEMSDEAAMSALITENLHREDISPVAKAQSFAMLLARQGGSVREAADSISLSHRSGYRLAAVARLLDGPWAQFVLGRKLSLAFLEHLASYDTEQLEQLHLAGAADNPSVQTGQIGALQHFAENHSTRMDCCPWAEREPAWCADCPKRTSIATCLPGFDDPRPDACLDPACWDTRLRRFVAQSLAAAKAAHGPCQTVASGPAASMVGARNGEFTVPHIVEDGRAAGSLVWGRPPAPPKKQSPADRRSVLHATAAYDLCRKAPPPRSLKSAIAVALCHGIRPLSPADITRVAALPDADLAQAFLSAVTLRCWDVDVAAAGRAAAAQEAAARTLAGLYGVTGDQIEELAKKMNVKGRAK